MAVAPQMDCGVPIHAFLNRAIFMRATPIVLFWRLIFKVELWQKKKIYVLMSRSECVTWIPPWGPLYMKVHKKLFGHYKVKIIAGELVSEQS